MSFLKRQLIGGDVKLFKLVNSKISSPLLTKIMSLITYIGGKEFTISLSLLFFLTGIIKENFNVLIGGEMILSLSLSHIVVHVVKRLANRPRPYKVISNIKQIIIPLEEYSFPSGHTAAAFSLATTLSFNFPCLSVTILSFAILVGLSRVHLGVHYPSDVLIGGLIGWIFSWFIHLMYFI